MDTAFRVQYTEITAVYASETFSYLREPTFRAERIHPECATNVITAHILMVKKLISQCP